MAAIQVETPAGVEPVTLDDVKPFLRITISDDDDLLQNILMPAAREVVEAFLSRSLINKVFRQSFDSFPYYTDTVMSQLAYPPSYYALPRYSTTLWNYSQMIKLLYSPLVKDSHLKISYISSADGSSHDLHPDTDFIVDADSEPPRIFPLAGQTWPSVLYVPNAVQIHYTAGYGTDGTNVPTLAKVGILQTVGSWYENRESVSPVDLRVIPGHVQDLLWSLRVLDLAPTRG